jgi:hypothetical protein
MLAVAEQSTAWWFRQEQEVSDDREQPGMRHVLRTLDDLETYQQLEPLIPAPEYAF